VKDALTSGLLRVGLPLALVAAILISVPHLFPGSLAQKRASASPSLTRFFVYFPLYLQTGVYVTPVEYFVPSTSTPARAAIEALVAGLPDKAGMMIVSLPKETKVRSISIKNGVCTVDFSEDIRRTSVGSAGEAALVESIVRTLCQFQTVDSVQIMIEGKLADSLAGHVDISGPLKCSSRQEALLVTFEDARTHWGGGAVSILQAMDIVNGYPDNTFKPDRQLTRAEFLKMLVESMRLPYIPGNDPPQDIPFKDVATHWCLPFLERALKANVVTRNDYGQNFGPDEVIPREEMAHLLLKGSDAFIAQHPEIRFEKEDTVPDFTDSVKIQERYRAAVMECARRGLIKGYPDGSFRPAGALTRAEACAVLTRMLGISGQHVLLATPRPGFKWDGSDLFFLGSAAAFEGTVNFRVRVQSSPSSPVGAPTDPSKSPVSILESYTTSTNGMGWGSFGFCIHQSLLAGQEDLVLEVYLINPKDGSEGSLVAVPLARQP